MPETEIQLTKTILEGVFTDLEDKGFKLTIQTPDGDKTPLKDQLTIVVDALVKGFKEHAKVKVDGQITVPPNGGVVPVSLLGELVIV